MTQQRMKRVAMLIEVFKSCAPQNRSRLNLQILLLMMNFICYKQ